MTFSRIPRARTPHGLRNTLVSMTNPGQRVRNDDGTYDTPRVALTPADVYAAVEPAVPRDLEQLAAGTVLSVGSYLITIPYHPQVSTKTKLSWTDRNGLAHTADATGVTNPDQFQIETLIVAVEITP
jgi:hypothetical protein